MEMAREDEKTKRTGRALVASDVAILWKMGAGNCGCLLYTSDAADE